jgi:nucleoside-diphosphate-sugar epimerase
MNPLARDLDHILAHTPEVWAALRDARIFVTGGTGFFGCWLLESYAWAWDRLKLSGSMTVLTRSAQTFHLKAPHLASHPAIRLIEGDVRSFDLAGAQFSHVIHAATDATPELCRERPLLVLDTIVDGTRRTLDFAVEAGARRFLLTSSGSVYGAQPRDMSHMPETYSGGPDVTDQKWVYAEGKRIAEMLCTVSTRQSGVHCLLARCFAFVGPYLPLDAHFAIGNFIRDAGGAGASACQPSQPVIRVNGDGTPVRSYLYAADLAIWLWTILVKGQSGRPYNVGSENAVSIADLARMVAAGGRVEIARTPVPGMLPERYIPDCARARTELNLKELIPLDEAIRRTAGTQLVREPLTAELPAVGGQGSLRRPEPRESAAGEVSEGGAL